MISASHWATTAFPVRPRPTRSVAVIAEAAGRAVEVVTFGCRLNAYESEVIRERAAADGLADAVVFNTCAVTGEAVRQARQAIRKARRERPDARLIVTGCAAQIDPAAFAAMAEVDLVLGNAEKAAPAPLAGHGPPRAGRRHHGRARDRRHLIVGPREPRPGLCRGPERLRPPLHLLHHPLRPRQLALGRPAAMVEQVRGLAAAGLRRGGADRRRPDQLGRGPAGRAGAGPAGRADPEAGPGAAAPAPVVHRRGRDRPAT